jgi:prevent-host-death family protein
MLVCMAALRQAIVNIHEAKTHLSELLGRVCAGEEVVIARAGHPIARLVPYELSEIRELGIYDGFGSIAEDFDTFIPPGFESYS